METENKIRFMFRQRDLIANQTNASVVSTGATAVKALGRIASIFVPGLGVVIGAATLVSYAPKMVSGYAMAKEWGKLKETHFKPIDPLKLTKEMKKQICRRLGIPIKQLDPTFLEAKQLMTPNDKIWLKQMLIQAGVLAETDEDISEDKMAHLIAALIID